MTPITVNGHNLLVIDVPKSVIIYDIVYEIDNTRLIIADENGTLEYIGQQFIPFGFKYSIIGTISKEGEFSFDPSEIIESKEIAVVTQDMGILTDTVYKCYLHDCFDRHNKQESFISLLKSAGIYLSNPMGEKPLKMNYTVGIKDFDRDRYQDDVSQWESYESKTIKGQVLILKQEKV